ncbi:phage antirepressor KilAC domain-containing protein [Stenotrophomonas pictorum]|uniref:phage antirepressor KilAC domain-containing protein n=1 Tax=Stenotrophomonas pictorum TaxID=86184 RepID=UPI0009F98DAA|nr:phage antirepressor KilAC domain-containing protein [Stenotrophomonas pictorum]
MQLTIAAVSVRQDAEGRFSLNDLHIASGAASKHQPSNWLRSRQARELIEEIDRSSDMRNAVGVLQGGVLQGTYVVKELVYAYAMWISPAFHLQVIRAYDQRVAAPAPQADVMAILSDPAALRGLLLGYGEQVEALRAENRQLQPKARALDTIADAEGTFPVTEAAKLLAVPPLKLFSWLQEHAWIYRRPGSRNWLAYQPRLQTGVLVHKVTVLPRPDGEERVCDQVRVTGKGLARLAELLSREALGWTNADHLAAMSGRGAAAMVVR